jgi:hypothetical protein
MKELGGEMEESHDEEENLCFWHHVQKILWQNRMKKKA